MKERKEERKKERKGGRTGEKKTESLVPILLALEPRGFRSRQPSAVSISNELCGEGLPTADDSYSTGQAVTWFYRTQMFVTLHTEC
jgi:hypothetical protein